MRRLTVWGVDEGNCPIILLELYMQGCKIPKGDADVNKPQNAQDDVNVSTDGEEQGIDLECFSVNL